MTYKIPENKICNQCGNEKASKEDFGPRKNSKWDKRAVCNSCMSENMSKWRTKNRIKDMNNHLKRNYGMTLTEYYKINFTQQGVCKICNKIFEERKQVHVDHCHKTNKVRGLLCMNCNQGLGQFKDKPLLLNLAVKYLEAIR